MIFRVAVLACVLFAATRVELLAANQDPVYPRAIISVRDQKLMVLENNERVAVYPVSTSKFGLGDRWGSMATPLGWLQVAEKIGDHAPSGAVFHKRRFTGEILQPNAPVAIRSSHASSGSEVWSLRTPTPLIAAFTFMAPQRKNRLENLPASVAFECARKT